MRLIKTVKRFRDTNVSREVTTKNRYKINLDNLLNLFDSPKTLNAGSIDPRNKVI